MWAYVLGSLSSSCLALAALFPLVVSSAWNCSLHPDSASESFKLNAIII